LKNKISIIEIKMSEFYFLDLNHDKKIIVSDTSEFILLDFWHTACAPCIDDHQVLKKKQNDFNDKKIKLISISCDQEDRVAIWKKYIEKNRPYWENYIEPIDNSLTNSLSIRIFPTYILLDKQNKIKVYSNSLKEVLTEMKIH
jgi:thiol-disulfide isomerase/thioredoxin